MIRHWMRPMVIRDPGDGRDGERSTAARPVGDVDRSPCRQSRAMVDTPVLAATEGVTAADGAVVVLRERRIIGTRPPIATAGCSRIALPQLNGACRREGWPGREPGRI